MKAGSQSLLSTLIRAALILLPQFVSGAAPGSSALPATAGCGEAARSRTPQSEAALRMEQKLERVDENGKAARPKRITTVLTEEEINAYFALCMGAKLPPGVSGVRFELHPGQPAASGMVDFDEFKAGSHRAPHPILDMLLRGRKPVAVKGTFSSSRDGYGTFHLGSVSLGGYTVEGVLLDLLVRWFVLPRYPNAAVDRPFRLPAKIERGAVEEGRAVLYQ